ncbi:hypothetical protein EDD16DRAFT_1435952, partial [Pisolithus croceorrhizus]
LNEHEWLVLGQLCKVLKILKDATLFFSHGMLNLAMVIPAMDYINEIFMTAMLDDMCLDPSIQAAVGLAKRTLNRYYLLTDMSNLYHIVMVLHPHHKLEYFRQVKWETDWIKTA